MNFWSCLATISVMTATVAGAQPSPVRINYASFISINFPGSTFTASAAINDAGDITGSYSTSEAGYGFLRTADGKFVSFGPPQGGITPTAIDSDGTVAGLYTNPQYATYAFVRSPDGTFSTHVISSDCCVHGIQAVGISAGMLTSAFFTNFGQNTSGFLWIPKQGEHTVFNATEASNTIPVAINASGVIAGDYTFQNYYPGYAFIRMSDGTFTEFGACSGYEDTTVTAINGPGTVVGGCSSQYPYASGFVRLPAGVITNVTAGWPVAINNAGVIVGYTTISSEAYLGFIQSAEGAVTYFNVPGGGTGAGEGTRPTGINNDGTITGYYIDSSFNGHGFLLSLVKP